jgi:Pyruvate/2-oxoacid:ferredoxin oxidoreductase delta subunit
VSYAPEPSLAVVHASAHELAWPKKLAAAVASLGALALLLAFAGRPVGSGWTAIFASLGLLVAGSVALIALGCVGATPGIRHNEMMRRGLSARGAIAWAIAVFLTAFYVVLYFYDDLRGRGMPAVLEGGIRLLEPASQALRHSPSDRWFLYGTLYTLAVLVMGVRMLLKYRHSRYQQLRTASVMFFQLGFAFLLPGMLMAFNEPEYYFSYFWPLKYDYLLPDTLSTLLQSPGALGGFMVFWGAVMALVATPILSYFFGKRWYCSWVCGCGGLAETVGDPFRQNSDKSERAWWIERWVVHSVLVLITLVTALLWIDHLTHGGIFGSIGHRVKQFYGLYIGAIFSGVIGVGFYPLMGSRVWCRFGCPMAAVLGIFQRCFSRFRITTNGGQCISCGNCSTYCEMGIDVRAYAQKGENIVRASCVGCGVCSSVCPRGVLNLENGPTHADRFPGADQPIGEFLKSLDSGRTRSGASVN